MSSGAGENLPKLRFRQAPRPADVEAVHELAAATGFFSREECAVAAELVDDRLRLGARSGYDFAFAEAGAKLLGYAAWGPVPMTDGSYDLYWIVVHPELQGRGLGRILLARAEEAVLARGARQVYIETSGRALYAPTRRFYRRCGYRQAAKLESFYGPGEHKIIFCKPLIKNI
ncbi:MAG TPA: GNAT family N-acetyltransferase [Gammaproteobacteria bacterium]|nr:GNAT family N-acetyltransferase [Gammaproteobacteria bacterium]